MNSAATHFITDVAAWVEHEEIVVVSILKRALGFIDRELEAITVLGLLGVCMVGVIIRLSQLSQYAQLIFSID
jgi:hypothetical protein